MIILIDGWMVQRYPPSPMELYEAMAAGVMVGGAASLGALRAVELGARGCAGGVGFTAHISTGRSWRMTRS